MAVPTTPTAVPSSRPPRAAHDERLLPPPVEITPQAGAILLRLARAVIAATASGRPCPAELAAVLPPDPPASLVALAAAFVTIRRGDELRGCVGSLAPDQPLWRSVLSAAVSAARDPRFPRVAAREVPGLKIDVSVLGPAVPLASPEDFRPGVDGLIVERGFRRALMLPEVATEHGWGAPEMLAATCWKAGLVDEAWRDAGTTVRVFRTARISDRDGGFDHPSRDRR
jgi:AmmeMemoRadiSam system protein A